MGRKKRRGVEFKPFCFYCDRDFDDEKVLIQHQKAKHFKCSECNRKLDTATGLVVHMLHVHKDAITKVPNSLQGRDNPELIIHGMEGVPQDVINDKQQKTIDEKGLAKHLKSAHTVFGMGVINGLDFMPDGFNPQLFQQMPGGMGLQMPQQFMPAPIAPPPLQAPMGMQMPQPTPQSAAPPVRHSGIAINIAPQDTPAAAATGSQPADIFKPGSTPAAQAAAPPGPPQPKINIVYSDDQLSMEEMVAIQKYGYKAG